VGKLKEQFPGLGWHKIFLRAGKSKMSFSQQKIEIGADFIIRIFK
jgi:hypothetical protein